MPSVCCDVVWHALVFVLCCLLVQKPQVLLSQSVVAGGRVSFVLLPQLHLHLPAPRWLEAFVCCWE